MSGGSYSYLYRKDSLVGHSHDLESMAKHCRHGAERDVPNFRHDGKEWVPKTMADSRDLELCAKHLDQVALEVRAMEIRGSALMEFYGDLLHAIEWSSSGDSGDDGVVDVYRKLTSKGPE